MKNESGRIRWGIRWRWWIATIFLILLTLGGLGILTVRLAERSALDRIRALLEAEADLASRLLAGPLSRGETSEALDSRVDEIGRRLHVRVTLIRTDGVVSGDSEERAAALPGMANQLELPEVREALANG
ncbi:MAG TPA: hypothetical protein VFG95_02610, partial [Nitrospiria bacterium]|nr:hypothetical protein [Nitrospiria bacterium]